MPWERSIGKASASKLKIYAKKDGRYDVSWYDQVGKRHVSTRQTLAAAKSFQAQKIAELQRHRETKFDLDDREMYSLARDLASSHGYTVLQAVQECHRSKGSSTAMPLGEVIVKFLGAKSNRSAAYMDKLNADMRLFQAHFGANGPIEALNVQEHLFS
jgi:hypothetical protein